MKIVPTTAVDRKAFTLLELLIVMGIIAILMSLTFSVMYGLTSQAEAEATAATIRKIDGVLQQRIDAFNRAFKGPRKDAAADIMRLKLAQQNIHGVRDEVIEILAKKRSFRFEFPQRMAERYIEEHASTTPRVSGMADSVFTAIAAPNAREQLIAEGDPNPTDTAVRNRVDSNWKKHDPTTESAEMLYFALTSSASYGVGAVDNDRFNEREIADTDEDGLPEFIDAWGQPLRFYRWPTRLIDMNPPSPFRPDLADPADATDVRAIGGLERETAGILIRGLSPPPLPLPNGALPRDLLLTDPDDPVGRLYSELERLNGANGKPLLATEFNEVNYHTPDTYHTPLIISPGLDADSGLLEPYDDLNGNLGNLAQLRGSPNVVRDSFTDNITNRNRSAGARR
ncbi:MAG: type II secretion system protein [Planctomycetaceae bacterium]|nr:type II secretion system protein [Planctomycetaceae bacterium]